MVSPFDSKSKAAAAIDRTGAQILMLLGCIVAICFMFRPTMHYVLDEHVPIGQNYSTVAPAPTNAD